MEFLHQAIYSLLFSVGFGIVYRIRGKALLVSSIGGMLSWMACLFFQHFVGLVMANFFAALVFSTYAELSARLLKKPASLFLVIALFPLVPGTGIYATMQALVRADYTSAQASGMETLSIAGALALGIVIVSSFARIVTQSLQACKKGGNKHVL